eukprot:Hpha_TRINITY_DN8239_c0_g1::TRINITY_DN8239_c0_g1_i1::g.111892::m.111892
MALSPPYARGPGLPGSAATPSPIRPGGGHEPPRTENVILRALGDMDAYSVLPSQPLGDFLRGIVETLRLHEQRLERQEREISATRRYQLKAVLDALALSTDRGIRQRYHEKCMAWLAGRKKQAQLERQQRQLEAVLRSSSKGLVRVYHQKAINWTVGGEGAPPSRRWEGKALRKNKAALVFGHEALLRRVYHRRAVLWYQQRMIKKRRQRAGSVILRSVDTGLLRLYYIRWLNRASHGRQLKRKRSNLTRLVRGLRTVTEHGLRAIYHGKIVRNIQWVEARGRRRRHFNQFAAAVLGRTDRGTRLVAFRKWLEFRKLKRGGRGRLDAKETVIAAFSSRSDRLMRLRYYNKLLAYPSKRREDKILRQQAIASSQLANEIRHRLNMTCEPLKHRSDNTLRRRYFDLLRAWRRKKKNRKHSVIGAFALAHKIGILLARRHFLQLLNFSRSRVRVRERELLRQVLGLWRGAPSSAKYEEMLMKCEALGAQVDVGLRTLSNTNSVLNKVVDRLINVDEQLDHLDKEKLSRADLQSMQPPPVAQLSPVRRRPGERRVSPPKPPNDGNVPLNPLPGRRDLEERWRILPAGTQPPGVDSPPRPAASPPRSTGVFDDLRSNATAAPYGSSRHGYLRRGSGGGEPEWP